MQQEQQNANADTPSKPCNALLHVDFLLPVFCYRVHDLPANHSFATQKENKIARNIDYTKENRATAAFCYFFVSTHTLALHIGTKRNQFQHHNRN